MKTNSKPVREIIKQHIIDTYTNVSDLPPVEVLKADLKAVSGMPETQTVYQQAKYLVDGGSFLVYYSDIIEFLEMIDKECNINPKKKAFDEQKSWELYKHLIASEIEKLVK